MTTRTWYFLSDLHLGDDEGGRDLDRALPQFLSEVVRRGTDRSRTLVLLGDTVDLHGPTRVDGPRVIARLRHVAAGHEPVFRALGECVRAGIAVEVVGGNHDVELTRPGVAACFRTMLGLRPDDPRVEFSPWVLHERGVFYAEHGNQHFELNRLPTIAAVDEPRGTAHLPVTPLAASGPGAPWCPVRGPRVWRVVRALRDSRRQEALVTSPWYRVVLSRAARRTGLDVELLAELARASPYTRRKALIGATRRVAQRRLGREPDAVLLARAEVVHRTMTRHHMPAVAYVFGHDHRAARCRLASDPRALYLNAGTWCRLVRGRGPDREDLSVFPFVRVSDGPTGVCAEVGYFDHVPRSGGDQDPVARPWAGPFARPDAQV